MFTFPPSMWVGGIFYEHGHRLIASAIGFLTIILAVWLWRSDSPRWMKGLGFAALAAVVLQGLLGGITVLFFLPTAVSTAHAGLAQIYFCLTVAIAVFTSPGWVQAADRVDDRLLRWTAAVTTGIIYGQIVIGAAMRHSGAGLAIPDFPLMFGGVLPDRWSPAIAVHFAHRVGALVVALAVIATSAHVWYHHGRRTRLTRPAGALLLLIGLQIALGALTVLSRRHVWINSAHVVVGAAVLATSFVLTLRSWRIAFRVDVPAQRRTASPSKPSASPTPGAAQPVPRGV
jgi:cytochrome c oxidase assembly protein subunit 15